MSAWAPQLLPDDFYGRSGVYPFGAGPVTDLSSGPGMARSPDRRFPAPNISTHFRPSTCGCVQALRSDVLTPSKLWLLSKSLMFQLVLPPTSRRCLRQVDVAEQLPSGSSWLAATMERHACPSINASSSSTHALVYYSRPRAEVPDREGGSVRPHLFYLRDLYFMAFVQ